MSSVQTEALLQYLRREGPTPTAVLLRHLQVSRSTFSRLITAISDKIVCTGETRTRRYAARRSISEIPLQIPLYEIIGTQSYQIAVLHPLYPQGFYVESTTPIAGFYDGLPWFLEDLRPTGFLGRLIPRQYPSFPQDILLWTNEDVVRWLYNHGADQLGNLILGDVAFEQTLRRAPNYPVFTMEREMHYGRLAEQVMALGIVGSSAGGEQPKFLATRMDGNRATEVLVKFSAPVVDRPSQRVADLLRSEHLALQTLRDAGISASTSQIVESDRRVMIEVERFDRLNGRRGIVSLQTLDNQFVGSLVSWRLTAEIFHSQGRISSKTLEQVVLLERFGTWIGNSDMHLGNLSFFMEGGVIGELTPVYDMLPMRYWPINMEARDVLLEMPKISPSYPHLWHQSWALAIKFWSAVGANADISPNFRAIAAQNLDRIWAVQPVL